MTTTILATTNGYKPTPKQKVLRQRASGNVAIRSTLPEYLEPPEVDALIHAAPHGQSRLIMLEQWRAGLRVSEAVALEVADLQLDGDQPTLRVRQGKGSKARVVPVHPELASAFRQLIDFGNVRHGPWRWTKEALRRAQELGTIPAGRWAGTHTLRHSAARHWLANGVPINHVSRWLGHASIATTLVYLEILPDPTGYMDRAP